MIVADYQLSWYFLFTLFWPELWILWVFSSLFSIIPDVQNEIQLWRGDYLLSYLTICGLYYYAWFKFSSRVLVETFGVRTNVDIHTLVRESSITRQDIRDILISFDSGLIYQHVYESFERRRKQVESVEDETNVPFTRSFLSCLVLSQRECKPGIRINQS